MKETTHAEPTGRQIAQYYERPYGAEGEFVDAILVSGARVTLDVLAGRVRIYRNDHAPELGYDWTPVTPGLVVREADAQALLAGARTHRARYRGTQDAGGADRGPAVLMTPTEAAATDAAVGRSGPAPGQWTSPRGLTLAEEMERDDSIY